MTTSPISRTVWQDVWNQLFERRRHLDSTLSKVPRDVRSQVAGIILPFLRMPATLSLRNGFEYQFEDYPDFQKVWPFLDKMSKKSDQTDFNNLKATKYDYPPAMIQSWKEEWGDEGASYLIASLSKEPKIGLRLSSNISKSDFLDGLSDRFKKLTRMGGNLNPNSVIFDEYVRIKDDDYVKNLFENGKIDFQDTGSQWLSLLALWPKEFDKILQKAPHLYDPSILMPELLPQARPLTFIDACAGAGGKSLAIADYLKGKGRVYSYDVIETKLAALRKRSSKIPLTNLQTVLINEGQELVQLRKHFGKGDIVMVDAPCSGWGTLRRSPDLKWKQSVHEFEKLESLQLKLLSDYSRLVSKAGRLVYSTCTFRLAETRRVVSKFLESKLGFQTVNEGFIGPSPDGSMDAFYIHVMEKKNEDLAARY